MPPCSQGGQCRFLRARRGRSRGVISVVVEEEKGRKEVVLVVGKGEEKEEEVLVVGKGEEKEEEVQVCIPSRNALLLMRCRSDPVKMAALTTRLLDSPAMKVHIEERDEEEENSGDRNGDQCANSIVATEGEEKEAAEARHVSQDAALTEQPPVKESGEELNPDMEKQTKIEEQGEGAAAELVELEEKGKENATADEEEQKQAVAESEKANLEKKKTRQKRDAK